MSGENPVLALVRLYWTPLALSLILLAITVLVWAMGDGVLARTVTDAWIRAVLVVGLYIFIGNSGVLVFGHIAFTLIGAYATAWLTLSTFKKSFALQLPAILADYQYPVLPSAIASATLAALVALVVGFPIMRLSGLAASIASLAVLGMFHTFYTQLADLDDGRGDAAGRARSTWTCGWRSAGSWWRCSSRTSISAPASAWLSGPRGRMSSPPAPPASTSPRSG